jgi:hypothetical protein
LLLIVVAHQRKRTDVGVQLAGQSGCRMAIGDGIFVVGRRSKQFLWLTLVFRSGVRFYIWATVIFRFAITGFEKGFEKRGQENHKITRNLGFHFGESWK